MAVNWRRGCNLSVIVVAALAATTACASIADHASGGATGNPAVVATDTPPSSDQLPDCSGGSGFAVSLAPGTTGSATPELAAEAFVEHSTDPGYGTAATRWRRHADPQGFTLTSGRAQLHVLQLVDGTWGVDSGRTCE